MLSRLFFSICLILWSQRLWVNFAPPGLSSPNCQIFLIILTGPLLQAATKEVLKWQSQFLGGQGDPTLENTGLSCSYVRPSHSPHLTLETILNIAFCLMQIDLKGTVPWLFFSWKVFIIDFPKTFFPEMLKI